MGFRKISLGALLIMASSAWSADGGQLVQQKCANCHGEDGIGLASGTPHLNGQLETYLVDMMQKLQSGRLPTVVENHIPAEFAASELQAVAAVYTASKAVRPKQEVDPAKLAKGEEIYLKRCTDCHIDNGRDADKDAPLMAAQNLQYLLAQTELFVSGKRKFGFLQDDAFRGLSRDELESVAHFFASQEQVVAKVTGRRKRR
jgi:cytochrome subunit of sulfide dehydrogenase